MSKQLACIQKTDGSAIGVVAKVDTGADRTSVDQEICEALGWPVVSERTITNANVGHVGESTVLPLR